MARSTHRAIAKPENERKVALKSGHAHDHHHDVDHRQRGDDVGQAQHCSPLALNRSAAQLLEVIPDVDHSGGDRVVLSDQLLVREASQFGVGLGVERLASVHAPTLILRAAENPSGIVERRKAGRRGAADTHDGP
jgi:hypothetical protein